MRNEGMRFVDDWCDLEKVGQAGFFFFFSPAQLSLPIAHGDGRFYAQADELKRIEDQGQVWMRYTSRNPNGSLNHIAGVMNRERNVVGLMPHPERASAVWMGGTDGGNFL